jgi:hypothetical protein
MPLLKRYAYNGRIIKEGVKAFYEKINPVFGGK